MSTPKLYCWSPCTVGYHPLTNFCFKEIFWKLWKFIVDSKMVGFENCKVCWNHIRVYFKIMIKYQFLFIISYNILQFLYTPSTIDFSSPLRQSQCIIQLQIWNKFPKLLLGCLSAYFWYDWYIACLLFGLEEVISDLEVVNGKW